RDGRLAVAAGKAVRLFDVETGTELPALLHPAPGAVTESVCWHPDGRRLATGCTDRRIHLWDTQTAREVMTPWVDGASGNIVAFHPDGDLLVSRGWGDSSTRVWDTATGRLLLTAPGLGSRFSPDGRLLGHGGEGNRVRLWRLAAGREVRALRRRNTEGQGAFGYPILHPDRRTLATSGPNWLSFFDVVSG